MFVTVTVCGDGLMGCHEKANPRNLDEKRLGENIR